MRIRYVGLAGLRQIGGYTWSKENRFVTEVDTATAADLLTYPRPQQFTVDGDEPLLALTGVGQQTVAELAVAGIGSIAELATLDQAGIERLAGEIWASAKQIRGWVKQAQEEWTATVERLTQENVEAGAKVPLENAGGTK
jgi:predicted flap endonuclease-1-like 5' DNA nuclease